MPPDTPLSTNYSSIQCLQHFRSDFIFSSSLFRFQSLYGCCYFCHCEHFLFPNSIKLHMYLWVLLLLSSTNLQSIFSNMKGFPSHCRGCFQLNPLWKLWYLNFSHSSGKWSAKIHCLQMNSRNPTDDQITPKSIVCTFLLPELQLFTPVNTGIANQTMICFATKP